MKRPPWNPGVNPNLIPGNRGNETPTARNESLAIFLIGKGMSPSAKIMRSQMRSVEANRDSVTVENSRLTDHLVSTPARPSPVTAVHSESLIGRGRLAAARSHEQVKKKCPASTSPSSPSGLFLDGLTDEEAGLQYDLSVLECDTTSTIAAPKEQDLEQPGKRF